MKILWLGGNRQIGILREALRRQEGGPNIDYVDTARADAELRWSRGQYNWIIFDGQPLAEGGGDAAHAIQTMGDAVPTDGPGDAPVDRHSPPAHAPPPGNGEEPETGTPRWRCWLHEMPCGGSSSSWGRHMNGEGVVFEYHAPCIKKKAQRGG